METEKKKLSCGQIAGICFIVATGALVCAAGLLLWAVLNEDSYQHFDLIRLIVVAASYIPLAVVLLRKKTDTTVIVTIAIVMLAEAIFGETAWVATSLLFFWYSVIMISTKKSYDYAKTIARSAWFIPGLVVFFVKFPLIEWVYFFSPRIIIQVEELAAVSVYALAQCAGYLLCCKWLAGFEKDLQDNRAEKTDGNAI